MRKNVFFGTILVAALVIGALIIFKALTGGHPAPTLAVTSATQNKVASVHQPKLLPASPAPVPIAVPPAQTAPVQPKLLPPDQIIADLMKLSDTKGHITKEQAEQFKKNLEQLILQGAASVPSIQEFLDKNMDSDYSELDGGDQLGYSSFRASLIDALKQIGGPEAQTAMVKTLQTSAFPGEILDLAKGLEEAAPGQYRNEILNAARESIRMADANELGDNVEVGPAYRALDVYGHANTTEEAAKINPENFRDVVALANQPNGQGLPSLIDKAQNTSGSSQSFATEMIAQLAGQNPQALDALTQMAQSDQIPQSVWVKLAPILAGEEYQVGGSADQGYQIVNNATTPYQINQRLSLIDKFLGMVPTDSAAAFALKEQRDQLNAKLQ